MRTTIGERWGTPMNSPLKHALQHILKDQARVWSYEEDFDELWAFLDGDSRGTMGTQVILWLRTPQGNCDPINTGPLVSPIAWAVCAASRAGALQSFRVTIVDLASVDHAEVPLRDQIGLYREESIPWLKFVSWAELLKDSVVAVREALLGTPDSRSLDHPAGDVALKQLRQTLRLKLTDPTTPDDRHAISNLIGPIILLGDRPAAPFKDGAKGPSAVADHLTALHTILGVHT